MGHNDIKRRKPHHALFWLIFLEVLVVMAGIALLLIRQEVLDDDTEEMTISYEEYERQTEPETYVPRPEIDEQYLTVNEWSRPGEKIKSLDYIVIHYLANPETTAQQNHDYFESLKDLQNNSMSANYVIGLDGEIIHCVPDDEVAYASNSANEYSISIENCHPDKTGRFTDDTYRSLVNLVAYLSDYYNVDREHIIRHYDVTGKPCPKYYVDHPGAWEAFLDEVMQMRLSYENEAKEAAAAERRARESEVDELSVFLENMTEE